MLERMSLFWEGASEVPKRLREPGLMGSHVPLFNTDDCRT